MFQNVELHWRKVFKTVVSSLTLFPDAPNLLYCCLLGKGSNLATYKLNTEFNLAIQAPGRINWEINGLRWFIKSFLDS